MIEIENHNRKIYCDDYSIKSGIDEKIKLFNNNRITDFLRASNSIVIKKSKLLWHTK